MLLTFVLGKNIVAASIPIHFPLARDYSRQPHVANLVRVPKPSHTKGHAVSLLSKLR
jgi:hypothetical protein